MSKKVCLYIQRDLYISKETCTKDLPKRQTRKKETKKKERKKERRQKEKERKKERKKERTKEPVSMLDGCVEVGLSKETFIY